MRFRVDPGPAPLRTSRSEQRRPRCKCARWSANAGRRSRGRSPSCRKAPACPARRRGAGGPGSGGLHRRVAGDASSAPRVQRQLQCRVVVGLETRVLVAYDSERRVPQVLGAGDRCPDPVLRPPRRGRAEAPALLPRRHVRRTGTRPDGECGTHRHDRPGGGRPVVRDRHAADRLRRAAGDGVPARRDAAGQRCDRQLRLGDRGVGAGHGRTLRGRPRAQHGGAGRPAPAVRRAPGAGAIPR